MDPVTTRASVNTAGQKAAVPQRSDHFLKHLFPFVREAMVKAPEVYLAAEDAAWSDLEIKSAPLTRNAGLSSWDEIDTSIKQCGTARVAYVTFLSGLLRFASTTMQSVIALADADSKSFGRFSPDQKSALQQIMFRFQKDEYEGISTESHAELSVPLALKRSLVNCTSAQRNATGRLLGEIVKVAESGGRYGHVMAMHSMYIKFLLKDAACIVLAADVSRLEVLQQQRELSEILESDESALIKGRRLNTSFAIACGDGMSKNTETVVSVFKNGVPDDAIMDFTAAETSSDAIRRLIRDEQAEVLKEHEMAALELSPRDIFSKRSSRPGYPKLLSFSCGDSKLSVITTICQPEEDAGKDISPEAIVWAKAMSRAFVDVCSE